MSSTICFSQAASCCEFAAIRQATPAMGVYSHAFGACRRPLTQLHCSAATPGSLHVLNVRRDPSTEPSTGDRSDCRGLLALTGLTANNQLPQHQHGLGPGAVVVTKKGSQVLSKNLAAVVRCDRSFCRCSRNCASGGYPDAHRHWLKCRVPLLQPQCCHREGFGWRRMVAEFYHVFLSEGVLPRTWSNQTSKGFCGLLRASIQRLPPGAGGDSLFCCNGWLPPCLQCSERSKHDAKHS